MIRLLVSFMFSLLAGMALAQPTSNQFYAPDGSSVPGAMQMCLNAQGQAVPTNQSGACPGGSGSSGAVTMASGAVASGAYSAGSLAAGAGVDGWNLTEGAIADAASTQGGTGSISAKLRLMTTQLNTINTNVTAAVPGLNVTAFNTNSYSTGQTNPLNADLNGNLYTNTSVTRWGGGALGAMANYGTSPGAVLVPGVNASITNTPTVTVGSVNSTPTNISAATSGTPSTATTLLAASAAHQKVVIKVEGATAVCFSQFGTAVIGAAGTWCLKGASTANAGDGGSYVTPGGMSEPNAISMISTGTSVLVTGWWQ